MEIDNGVYTVLMTPFNYNGMIDYQSYERLIHRQLNSNITGVVVLGTTSESPTLSDQEKMQLIQFVHRKFENSDKHIIIEIGGNDTRATINFGNAVANYCDYIMVTVPNYNRPTQEGIYEHFNAICSSGIINEKPIILYNIPSRTGVNMTPETVLRVANNNTNVRAIKEASGSISQVMEILSACNIKVFSGDDNMIIPISSVGGSGAISVISNIIPNEFSAIYRYCRNNQYDQARNIYNTFSQLINILLIESNPVSGKQILNLLDIFLTPDVRLPLTKLSNENRIRIEDVYNNLINNINFYDGYGMGH